MLNENFWKKYFYSYDALNRAIPYKTLIEDIMQNISPKKGMRIFDAGSGTGNISLALKSKDALVTSLDFSEVGIEIHKKKDARADVVYGDLTRKLPFKNASFDAIVSNNVIYTIPKAKRSLLFDEFFRIIKPGGTVVIANIHANFKPYKIFTAHLKSSLKKFGLITTFFDVIIFSAAIIKIFYYNYLIKRENKYGSYDFLTQAEQESLLAKAGFKVLSSSTSYAGQSYITKAIKTV